MRRILVLAAVFVLLLGIMVCPVFAETGANSVNVYATVSSDGSCQVTTTVLLHLEQAVGNLSYPVPVAADSVTLNGSRVHTTKNGTAKHVDLSGIAGNLVGEFSVTITYILRDLVAYNEIDVLQLQLPLLSGFAYPIQEFTYSITMPGKVTEKPAFSSGYHQANIEKDLVSQVSDAMLTGTSNKPLKDYETLTMTLPVSEEYFPQKRIELPDFNVTNTLMWICFVLAILYWLVFLRCPIPRRGSTASAPDGFSAGQYGAILHMQGADLTYMVFSWAQLGYLYIRKGRGGHILLQKRMHMGNERSGFEQRCFANLFGRRDVVDTSELRYVELWEKTAKMSPGIQSLVRSRPAGKQIFRVLAALIGLFGGAGVGIAISTGAALQLFWMILFALIGLVVCWHIQRWADGLLLCNKKPVWSGLALGVIWIVIGAAAGVFSIAFWTVIAQLLAGIMAAFGGRRTEEGAQMMNQVLGLRRYLRKVSQEDLQRICQNNSEYFFSMAPCALALGVNKQFAKHFGKIQLPECPYVDLGTQVQMSASGWSDRFQTIAKAMNERRKKMWLERLMGVVSSARK